LARGESALDAVRFGCALASLSVTRAGTAPSMPKLAEIHAVLGEPAQHS
ncbi:ribokinase, partial [Caballeronia sp. M23-90]